MNLFDLCVYKNLNKGSGGDVDVSSLVATENKTYNAGEGKAYNPVVVNVPTPPPSLQSLTVSHNGYFLPSSGYVGFDEVTVEVATPLETLSATENGTYTPSSGYEGFSEVTVNVPLPNNAYLLESQKGDVVTIQHGAEFDMPKLIASIEPQQSGSGDPSPENVRPISGWTACNVVRTGKNLFDKTATDTNKGYISGKWINQTGNTFSYGDWSVSEYIRVDGEKIAVSGMTVAEQVSSGRGGYCCYDKYKNVLGGGTYNALTQVITLPTNTKYIRISVWNENKDVCQLELSETASTYEPFGNTYTINFVDGSNPLIVYGGTLDVLSGVLTVDRGYVDLGSLNWTYESSSFFKAKVTGKKYGNTNVLCDKYAVSSSITVSGMLDKEIKGYPSDGDSDRNAIYVKDSAYTDATTFKTAMNGVQLVYELATPQTYQLTPTEVKSLLGVNNIFADTGEVDVQIWTKEVTS